MTKKILFRADGTAESGLGHLYRLFALVEIYKEQFDFVFLTKKSSVLSIFPSDYTLKIIPEEINISEEPFWIDNFFSHTDYIIISDGYQFTSPYQKTIKELGYFLIYIDDLAVEHMYADIVVNHSPNVNKKAFSSEPYTFFGLGADYAILRPSFLASAKQEKKASIVDTAFVCYGGSDYFDFTFKTVEAILKIKKIKKINVVVGGAYNHKEIYEVANKTNKIEVHKNLNELALNDLMNRSNISFVSASTILYEVITVKMPTYTGFFVQNQIDFYDGIKVKEVFFGMDDLRNFNFDTLPNKIEALTQEKIEIQIKNQKSIIDGEQKKRFLALL
jgi:UDP-2,4-diacetamido-2,4,6-trideoxy-beta-L-altropyranose hydrolase